MYHVFLIIRRHHHVRSLSESGNIWILGMPDATKQQLILGNNQVWSVDLRLHPTLKHVMPVTYGLLGGRLAARNLSFVSDDFMVSTAEFYIHKSGASIDKKHFPPIGMAKWAEDNEFATLTCIQDACSIEHLKEFLNWLFRDFYPQFSS